MVSFWAAKDLFVGLYCLRKLYCVTGLFILLVVILGVGSCVHVAYQAARGGEAGVHMVLLEYVAFSLSCWH